MDADGGGPKKRKAAATSSQRKKPRRSGRDKSEFVSVEVGMREFKKRLAATGTSDAVAAAAINGVEDLTQDVKAAKNRAKPKTSTTTKAPAARKTAATTRTTVMKAMPVKLTAAAGTKKATTTKKAAAEKKQIPVKRTTRATKTTAASKVTLAQVKLQLEREQTERVEHRIQTLHREAKPIAVASTLPITIAPTTPAIAALPPTPVVPAVVAPVPLPVRPAASVVASGGQQQNFGENMVVEAAAVPQPAEIENHVLGMQEYAPSALPTTQIPTSTAPVSSAEPSPSPAKNEFIADNMEEDLMFAMALEEVERKLATPQKPPPSSDAVAATNPSVSLQKPIASPVPVKSTLVESCTETQMPPQQVINAPQPLLTKTLVKSNQAEPAPEVLEEMERLRRENELLRRSNELLQAAATSPMQAEAPANELPCRSPDKSDAHDGNSEIASSPKDTASDTPAASSTAARFLDLARCDSDQDMKQMASTWEDRQPQERVTDRRSTENRSILSESQGEDIVFALSNEAKNPCEDQHKPDDEKKPATEQEITTGHASDLSRKVTSQELASTTPLANHSTLSGVDSHPFTQPIETDQEGETAPLEKAHPKELSSLIVSVDEHSAHATTRSNDGDVSDGSMSEADEEKEDEKDQEEVETVEEDGPTPRTSTIDSGNYAEYKVRHENDYEAADDEYMDETRDSKVVVLEKAPTLSIPVDAKSSETMVINEPGPTQKPGTPANSEIFDRTTAPSNSDDEDDAAEDEMMAVKRIKRREVIALSSSSSESESESESEENEVNDTSSSNVLEAALKAAGGDPSHKPRKRPSSAANGAAGDSLQQLKEGPSVAVSASSPSMPVKTISMKRKTPGLSSTNAKKPPSVKSSLLWPALDEFYDFLLDMSPRNVRGSEQKRVHLQQYAGGKLPTQHSSIEDYCSVQLEAIMEELVASVSNTRDRRGGGGSGPTRHLSLASVSPCGVQRGSSSSVGLSFGAIFSESGFTGSTSNSNDYILTFDASVLGKKGSSDFLSGDLVLVRSPRWKNYEMCVFGVVLCDSVVAVGGKSGPGGKGGGGGSGDSDQICVLIRAQKRDQEDAVENFSVLTELCLSNQRAPNWRWSLQQVHNTTTSAREFQAIKAISFFPNDLKQVLLRGQIVASTKTEQTSKKSAASSSILSPRLLKYLQKHYNDSQVQAILGCLGEDSRVIIQGPPGTGKTKTILGLLSALLDGAGLSTLQKAKGTARIRVGASLQSARTSAVSKTVAETSIRVLVAAPSNAAIDELVVRVLSEGLYDGEKGESYRPRIVRVGRPESSQQLSSLAAAREVSESKKNRKKMRKYAREVEEVLLESLVTKHRSTFPTVKQARQAIIKNAQIVFCTLSGAGSVAMCEFAQDFDALVIDEAAQAVEASTLIPFKFRPHRVVLVGDHRQLPATVISKKLVSVGYDRSLQQRLVENNSPVLLLTQQYRMHPEIAAFPSAYFYGGRLVQDDNMREWTAQDYHRDRAFKSLLFLDVQGAQSQVSGSTSLRNMNEVEAVVQLVRRLLKKFPHLEWKKRIGVIAPYKQQIYEVRGAIGKLEAEFNRHLGIEVNTVDGFQGREKEIIIYSCVRTSHGGRSKKKRRSHGNKEVDVLDAFWADERRMNVAITRAKSSLWIVGNSTLLKQSRVWRALIQHTKDHNRYIGDGAATLFATSSSTRKTSKPSK